MKTLKQACTPRSSVFDAARRDSVVDLTELVANRIDAQAFFSENYATNGMKTLLEQAFRRFQGLSEQGIFLLTQAMGGGKTHNLVALGLLARYPELIEKFFPEYITLAPPPVRVIAFSGRESDAPLGIWGALAEQLGKKEVFASHYSPLSAPGQTAWINLLRDCQPTLILLDELAPYFENARSVSIGNSDLAGVTTTALANLLTAVCKPELSQVCVVMSDLTSTYAEGSELLQRSMNKALQNMENEANRGAMRLEPVRLNSDEIYHILRTRLFEKLPDEAEIAEVAEEYARVLRQARQMDLTGASPEDAARQIRASYPFHFSFRDLYARFRENPGFQQTRGLIRLMRMVTAHLFSENGEAGEAFLIHSYHLNLNDSETMSEIAQINPTLRNAISHDIASGGGAVAEQMDLEMGKGNRDAQDAVRLILVSSLANVPNALRGLTESEVVAYLASPGRNLARLKKGVLELLLLRAWYLHTGRDNRILFKDVQNLVARLKTTAESLNRESQLKELKQFLAGLFQPSMKDCYQSVETLPALDQVTLRQDRVTLLLSEPYQGAPLHPDLEKFYADQEFKNRVMFLSGERNTMARLLEVAAELKAIRLILDDMKAERLADSDPQFRAATDLEEKIQLQLLAAAREAFTRLTFPTGQQLLSADFLMEFQGNRYNGEKQIRELLLSRQKFTEDLASETFRKKCEARLFTRSEIPWSEVTRGGASNPAWQWHHPSGLENLRQRMLDQDQWRDSGGYVNKGPFPAPVTDVRIQPMGRDEHGKATLKLTPVHGDRIVYEIGGVATPASLGVPDPKCFETSELRLSFLCLDSSGKHEPGSPKEWTNQLDVRHRIYHEGSDRLVELQAVPPARILYTSDGSDPRLHGGTYDAPVRVPSNSTLVLAVAERQGEYSVQVRVEVPKEVQTVDPHRPAKWLKTQRRTTTHDTFQFLNLMTKFEARAIGPRLTLVGGKQWMELNFSDDMVLEASALETALASVRSLLQGHEIELEVRALDFINGQALLDWVGDQKTTLKSDEVSQ